MKGEFWAIFSPVMAIMPQPDEPMLISENDGWLRDILAAGIRHRNGVSMGFSDAHYVARMDIASLPQPKSRRV